MKLSEAKLILAEGLERLCVISPSKLHERNSELCTIQSISGSWIVVQSGLESLNVRASEIEVLPVARKLGWR